jgi:hypothetical protein
VYKLQTDRWSSHDADYTEAIKYSKERKLRLALDHVEQLVVQRMMEMQKRHVRGTSEYSCRITSEVSDR